MAKAIASSRQRIIDEDSALSVEALNKKYGNNAHPVFGYQAWREAGVSVSYAEWVKTQLASQRSATPEEVYQKMLDDVSVENTNFNFVLMQLFKVQAARQDSDAESCFITANFKKHNVLKIKGASSYYFEKLMETLIKNDLREGYSEGNLADAVHFYETYDKYISDFDTVSDEWCFNFRITFTECEIAIIVSTSYYSIGVKIIL
jgi:hypothetical protein